MRTTIQALLCSFVATACAPIGQHSGDDGVGPDAGVDGGAVGGPCEDLQTKTMDLTISGTSGFTGLPTSCWKLAGKLTVTGPAVTSLDKLGDLREVTNLVIDDTDLTRFDTKTLVEVSGTITIRANDKLTDLTNLAPKATVQSVAVEYNTLLASLGGIGKVSVVSGETRITNNAKLASLELTSAQRLEGGLVIEDNAVLATISAPALTSVGPLALRRNGALKTITAGALDYIHGTLSIESNGTLTSLGTFGTDVVIDTGLVITGNSALTDVGGLSRADQIGTVSISGNSQLSTTKAHDIGCCVPTNAFVIGGTSGNCSGNHWCLNTQDCYR